MNRIPRFFQKLFCYILNRHTPAYLREHAESVHQIYRHNIPCLICACGHCGGIVLVPAYENRRKGAL